MYTCLYMHSSFLFIRSGTRIEEMAQWLRTAPEKGRGSVPSTDIGWLTSAYNSSFRGTHTFFWSS